MQEVEQASILVTLKTHHHNFALFSQTVYAIEQLLADDLKWVYTPSSTILHSQLIFLG